MAPAAQGGGVQTSIFKTIPPPIGGWNARDPLAAMKPWDAITLENWFPRVADCAIRGGCAAHKTGFAARPKTLMKYAAQTGTNKMFASTDAGIFDTTAAGAIGAAVLARTNGYHCWTQMAVSGGTYLIAPNGVDKPAYYDGTNWIAVDAVSVPALTGVLTTNLVFAATYQRRLYFLEKSKLNFWYLAADAIGGALTEFLLGPLCPRGGYTMAMANWSLDAGDGPGDYVVFVTSEGEAVVFIGTNPNDVTQWTLKGVYFVGKPLGRKCFKKLGGDLVLLTEYGAFPLSQALMTASIDRSKALSNKVEGAFLDAGRIYGTNTGFTMEVLPGRGALLINIPRVDGGSTADQYVMNTTTKSWCKFTGWNASDLLEFNKKLYFCDSNKVSEAWTDTFGDYGLYTIALGQTAWNRFGYAQSKDWKMFRPILRTNGPLSFSMGIAVDFRAPPTLSTATYATTTGARWDVSRWDAGMWAAGLEAVLEWQTPGAVPGSWGSGVLQVSTNALEIQWAANDYLFELGNVGT